MFPEISSYWYQFSENDTLKANYKYLDKLDFYAITYQSDSSIVKGITLEPKRGVQGYSEN